MRTFLSLRVEVKKIYGKNVKDILKDEERFGIKRFETYQKFAEKIYRIRDNVRKNIYKIKKDNKTIVGYGSPAKATTALKDIKSLTLFVKLLIVQFY